MVWMKILLISILILFVVCCISIWYASTHFHKVYYRLQSDKLHKPVKLVVLSDLHDQSYGRDNTLLLQAISEEKPDAVLVAGDMLTASENRKKAVAEELIGKLTKSWPVYYGIGNHERKMYWEPERYGDGFEAYIEAIKETGAVILQNSSVKYAGENIRIYGLDIDQRYYKRFEQPEMSAAYVKTLTGELDQSCYNIFLAHNPAYFDTYALTKPDLVLSGHVHGGLVRLPFLGGVIAPSLKLFPKYDGGLFRQNGSAMIISRGLGIHSIEFRMWNTAELVVLELDPANG